MEFNNAPSVVSHKHCTAEFLEMVDAPLVFTAPIGTPGVSVDGVDPCSGSFVCKGQLNDHVMFVQEFDSSASANEWRRAQRVPSSSQRRICWLTASVKYR